MMKQVSSTPLCTPAILFRDDDAEDSRTLRPSYYYEDPSFSLLSSAIHLSISE